MALRQKDGLEYNLSCGTFGLFVEKHLRELRHSSWAALGVFHAAARSLLINTVLEGIRLQVSAGVGPSASHYTSE